VPGESSTSTSTDGSSSSRPSDLKPSGGFTSISADGSSSSGPSDMEPSGGFTSTSAVGVSPSEDSKKIDLLAELQAAALLEDAAGDQTISDADLDW
ncbi:hypothetical protein M9458_023005, partial [Cirrhinus mrigala]